MAIAIVMPRLGWTMEQGRLVEWLKKDGDAVQAGDVLLTVESDKTINEVESFDSGILRIPPDSPPPDTVMPVGTLLAYIVQPGEVAPFEQPDARQESAISVTATADTQVAAGMPRESASGPTVSTRRRGPRISPRARRVAAELGVDWNAVNGSGRTGRIIERDVRAAARLTATASPAPVLAAGEARPVTPIRRIIAQRMAESAQTAAAVTLTTEADATELVVLRDKIKASLTSRERSVPTYTDLMVKLTAVALVEHPMLNATWRGDEIVVHAQVHIGVAVDTDAGLLVPVIRDAAARSLQQIAAESTGLAEKARTRALKLDETQGGTFTITNLGMYGIDAFTPLINLPQCAILGVGRIVSKPAVHGGQVVPRAMMTLSLTFDHRVVDGGPAARFLSTVREYVEQPYLWLTR
ncbi:MAG: 2-oxo acid dehydrogenase subunit E2 [Candidatus Latescibacteria bacterium]|nr:2-oxo acid dehydrogenase subunit E2 [Candidatus Latescibacterota bacterium]